MNQRDRDGMTPLTIAARASDLQLFHLFFDCPRTDLNLPDAVGWTPLMIACAQDETDMVWAVTRLADLWPLHGAGVGVGVQL